MSTQESVDNEHLCGNGESEYVPCAIHASDPAYGTKTRWKVRRFAERKHFYNSRKARENASDQDSAQEQGRHKDGRALSISSESNSSNTEFQISAAQRQSVWLNTCAVWTQNALESAIEALVTRTPSYLSEFREMTKASDLPNPLHLPQNVLAAITLSTALNGNLSLLSCLLEQGADPNAVDNDNRSAMHYAACSLKSNAVECAVKLLESGAAVNVWDKNSTATPLICAASVGSADLIKVLLDAGADADAGLNHIRTSSSTALLMAVRARSSACVQTLLEAGATVNTYQAYSEAPIHIAVAQGDTECLKLLLYRKADIRVLLGQSRMSALHLAAEEGNADCIAMLLEANADCNVTNARKQSPLHLAVLSHSTECITLLLKAGANPNALDEDMKAPLHSAVIKSSRSIDAVHLLLASGAHINAQDCFGYTPLHLAAIHENSKVAAVLILSGADWSIKTSGGISAIALLLRRTPDALKAIPHRLDAALSVADHDPLDHDCELHLNFKMLIPNYGHGNGETSLLMALVQGGQRQTLQHPVVRAFLQVKWTKIRSLFIASIIFHAIFVLFLTAYIVSAFVVQGRDCPTDRNHSDRKNEEQCLFSKWPIELVVAVQYSNIGLVLLCGLKELFQLLQKPSDYVRNVENCIHLGLIVGVVAINLPREWNLEEWQQHTAAIVIVVAWAELMMHVGRFPGKFDFESPTSFSFAHCVTGFGIYVQMFATVATNIAKFLAAYVSLIIGFSLGFAVLYPDNRSLAKLPYSLVSTIVMMTGELDYNNYFNEVPKYPVTSHVLFLVFLLFIVIVLMNLLVGLAVSDIQGLRKSARLNRLVRQIELVARMESIIFSPCFSPLSCWFRKQIALTQGFLQRKILVVPPLRKQIYNVRPNDPRDDRFPVDIKEALLKTLIAKKAYPSECYYDESDLFTRRLEQELLMDKTDKILETLNAVFEEIKLRRTSTGNGSRKTEDDFSCEGEP